MYLNKASSVFDLIEKIAATSSKNEKEALVKAGMALPLFTKVVIAAYDRFKQYGMRDLPPRGVDLASGGNTLDEPGPWEVLRKLASGELSGDAARAAYVQQISFLDEKSGILFRRIVLKDLRAGFTEGTVNRVAPKTFAEFPYMRCSLPEKSNIDKWNWSVGIFSQEKADGEFGNVNISDAGFLNITTRTGTPYPSGCMPELEAAFLKTLKPGTQTHGEFVVYEAGQLLPREKGNGILNSLQQGGALEADQVVVFLAWDQIPLAEVKPKAKYQFGYKARFVALAKQIQLNPGPVRMIPTKIVRSKAEATAHSVELTRKGLEGTVCKHPYAIWADGTSKDQVKLKIAVDVDLVVKAVVEGKADTKNAGRPGTLTCETSDGLLRVDVTVKNESMRDDVEQNPEDWIGRIMPVRFNTVTKPGPSNDLHSLFLPRFSQDTYRLDKTGADTLDHVIATFNMAAGLAAAPAEVAA